jgi:hypothetical protein
MVGRDPFDPQLPERSSEMRTGFFSPQLFPSSAAADVREMLFLSV